jgi:hypothetical protein
MTRHLAAASFVACLTAIAAGAATTALLGLLHPATAACALVAVAAYTVGWFTEPVAAVDHDGGDTVHALNDEELA